MLQSSSTRRALFAIVLSTCAASLARAADVDLVASGLVEAGGQQRGVCAVIVENDAGGLPVSLAAASELLVHVRCSDAAAVNAIRNKANAAGFGIDRLAVEHGSLDRLPYAENIIDVIIVPQWRAATGPSASEILRVLRPRGTALVAGDELPALTRAASEAPGGAEAVAPLTIDGQQWVRFAKPPLAGAGEWSHWEHGPDNNPVSEDAIIKFPYMTQYLQEPFYIAMPSITTAAGGRTFLAIGHIAHHRREWDQMTKLIARNGYNGTVLWERKLPEGYLVHRSAFIATDDAFYMIDGNRALLLDSQTGAERGEIRIPGVPGDWKWMVLRDGVLYVLAGKKDAPAEITKGDREFGGWSWADLSQGYYEQPRVPWGFGNVLAAYDIEKRELLWKHTEEEKPIDSRALSMGADRIGIYCPEQHLRCLELATGKVLWTNSDRQVLDLIEEPGKGLTSTPGFRSACMTLYTPDAMIIQGQTQQNVVAISTADGYLLWKKPKVTNNPNAIYVDGKVILGVGPQGTHVALDPVSGEIVEDLKFRKTACTRLTACSDSFFVRGEGTLRFDRVSKQVLIDGAARPACNDGALPANGLLYLGPWQCDCNLSLIGALAKCSAGDFPFEQQARPEEQLTRAARGADSVADFAVTDHDWPTFRGNNDRSASTSVPTPTKMKPQPQWTFRNEQRTAPTAPTAAGGLVFTAGEDGIVRAFQAESGQSAWTFATPSPIKYPPTVANGRLYFGSSDGYAYCLEAATGRELWRFRAAPVERHIPLFGHIASTWPVNSGMLVHDGIAYFAAGIIDYDGTYVYALNAETGEIVWQNNSSGHLNDALKKGISVQGNLSLDGDHLLLAGGNQVSPAPFDIHTGQCLAANFEQGQPKNNNGRFAGLLAGKYPIVGGRVLHSAAENVSTKGNFTVFTKGKGPRTLSFGGVAPAWDGDTVALVNYLYGKLTCLNTADLLEQIDASEPVGQDRRVNNLADAAASTGAVRWSSDLGEANKFEAVAVVVCPNAIVATIQQQNKVRAQPQWYVVAFDKQTGNPLWRHEIGETPLPDGLLVDRDGRVVVTTVPGSVICLAPQG
jgi:outer membrane protein assembly factor BamB